MAPMVGDCPMESSDDDEFFEYQNVNPDVSAVTSRGRFAKGLLSLTRDEDDPSFCYEAPCWTYCLQHYTALLSNRRVVETESTLNDFRVALARELKKLKGFASFEQDLGSLVHDLNETRHARSVFFKRVDRDAFTHPSIRSLGCESSHDAFVATLELELAECVAGWLSLRKPRAPTLITTDEPLDAKLCDFVRLMIGIAYSSYSCLRGDQRGFPTYPWSCPCIGEIWETLKDLCHLAGRDLNAFTFHIALEKALKEFVVAGCPRLSLASQGDLTFAWWFFDSIFDKDEVPSENVLDFLRRLTEKEKSEEALKLQLMHFCRCLRDVPSDRMIISLFTSVSAGIRADVTLGSTGDLRGYCSQPMYDSAKAWEASAHRVSESSDIDGSADSFGVFLHVVARRRDSEVVLRKLKFRLVHFPYPTLKERGWTKIFDLFLTCAVVTGDKKAVVGEFFEITKNLADILSKPTGLWTVAVKGLWALMIAVCEDSLAIGKTATVLELFLGRFLDAADAGSKELEKRIACSALVEYYSGLAHFLNEATQGPPSRLSHLLPKCSAQLVSKLSRQSGSKLLASISTIVQKVRQTSSEQSSRQHCNAEEESRARATSEWSSRILDCLWEPVKSIATLDKDAMPMDSVPPSQIGDILVEFTMLDKTVLARMMDPMTTAYFKIHPVILSSYLLGIVSMEHERHMDSDSEILYYAAWVRCRLFTPRLFWSREVDDMLDKLDETIMHLPLANRAFEASMMGTYDEDTLFSASARVVEEERRTWKQLVERFSWLYNQRQTENEVSKLPRIFAHVPAHLKTLSANLDEFFKGHKKRDSVLDCAVEVATFILTRGLAVTCGEVRDEDSRGFSIVQETMAFLYLTPNAKTLSTPLEKGLLEIASRNLPEVIMSFCEASHKSLYSKPLEKTTQNLFRSYVPRFAINDRHPVYKALTGFVGILPSKLLFSSMRTDFNTNERSSQMEMALDFLIFYLRQRRRGIVADAAVEELMVDVLQKGWNEPGSTNGRYKCLLETMMEYGTVESLRARFRTFYDQNSLMSGNKMSAIAKLIDGKRPDMSDDIGFATFIQDKFKARRLQTNSRFS